MITSIDERLPNRKLGLASEPHNGKGRQVFESLNNALPS